jgi:carboxyl-terminal processing protease
MSSPTKRLLKLVVLPLLFATHNLSAQTRQLDAKPSREVVQYLGQVQHLIKRHALYSDSLNWAQLSREVTEKSRGLVTVEDCKPVLDHILRTLRNAGDKHSFFLSKEKATRQNASSYAAQPAESRYLGTGLGYIKVPEFVSMDPSVGRAFSQGIQGQIQALETQHHPTGWVVDLRHNTGGNMHPMIDGLQALIDEGTYGYFIIPPNQKGTPLHNPSEKRNEQRGDSATKTPPRVAVLIDSLTASSGEMVALAFKGQSNVKFVGQRSAGYTTVNRDFRLSDGAYLLLATGYMADRNRTMYLNGVAPDVAVKYTSAGGEPDRTLEAAQRWLLEAR